MEIDALSVSANELVALDDGELEPVAGGLFGLGRINVNVNVKKNESVIGNSTLVSIGSGATSAIQVTQSNA